MNKKSWTYKLYLSFIIISILINTLHFYIFNDSEYIFKFILIQLGYLPISTLFVTFILNELLTRRRKDEKTAMRNMIISTFFSEVGTDLIHYFKNLPLAYNSEKAKSDLNKVIKLKEREFKSFAQYIKYKDFGVQSSKCNFKSLNEFLNSKRIYLIDLLQNSNLQEHETFSDLIFEVLHINEELSYREDLDFLSEDDLEHLAKDIDRTYSYLLCEWFYYMRHLNAEYPNLYSFAIKTIPFNK